LRYNLIIELSVNDFVDRDVTTKEIVDTRDCVKSQLLSKKMLICFQKSMMQQAIFSNNIAIFKIQTDYLHSLTPLLSNEEIKQQIETEMQQLKQEESERLRLLHGIGN
jgi:hypothetical protein